MARQRLSATGGVRGAGFPPTLLNVMRMRVVEVRRSILWAIAMLLAALPLAPSAFAAGTWTLSADGTSFVDVTLSSAVSLEPSTIATTGRGRFQGFYLERVDVAAPDRAAQGNSFGAVTFPGYHEPGEPKLVLTLTPGNEAELNAGRYRLYVLADGPTTVTVRGDKLTSRTFRAVKPARAIASVKPDILTSPVQADDTESFTLTGKRSISLVSTLVGKARAYAGIVGACLTIPGQQCGQATTGGGDGPYANYALSPLSDVSVLFTITYAPGALPPTIYDARHDAVNAGTLQYASAVNFTLALAP